MNGHVIPQIKGIEEWNFILKFFTKDNFFLEPLDPFLAPLKRGPPKTGEIKMMTWMAM